MRYAACAPGGEFPFSVPLKPMDGPLTIDEVFDAYFDCRKHKRNTVNQLRFEADLETNLVALYRELADDSYRIGRSVAFVVTYPKIREIWAADFRDRVVHHIIYNRISGHFYRRFIRDTYACIPGRGTHDGMRRVSGFARSITRNWTCPAYALKIDIANFFNSIDRHRLLEILERHPAEPWLHDLIRQVTLHDPRPNAVLRSSPALFEKVPPHKSLRRAPDGKGLPIGNLTSQFFANVYLNELDQYVKHRLRARYYGRYVDDMMLFHEDPGVLNSWYIQIDGFLQDRLALRLHPGKKHLNRAETGIDFTGFIIKPGRVYLRQTSLARCKHKIRGWERAGGQIDPETLTRLSASVNSYLGMLRQVNGYRVRESLCARIESLFLNADEECTKIWAAKQ
ncbi:MAG: reverse transcriptase domain-containing protein [Alphaproteobacteria bacterium]